MKNNLKAFYFFIFSSLGIFLISEQLAFSYPDPVDPDPCVPSYYIGDIGANPTLYVNYLQPEPGLTNETITIYGFAGAYVGSFDVWTTCPEDHYLATEAWDVTSTVTWSINYFSSSTNFAGGSIVPPSGLGGAANLSFVSPLNGNEMASIKDLGDGYALYGSETLSIDPLHTTPYPLLIPFSVLPRTQLIYLSFDNNALNGDQGQLPVLATGVPSPVPSPFGTGVDFDSTGAIDLEYQFFQNDTNTLGGGLPLTGSPNVRRNEGTVRFWFSPGWSSGSGPVHGGTFFDMFTPSGVAYSDIWTLAITNNGSTIDLLNAGGGFSLPVSFTANQWYQITVTYSPTATALYTNGVIVGSAGSGVSQLNTSWLGGFRVGSDGANQQVRGIMDEVKTYNYPMAATEVLSDYQADAALDTDGGGIPNIIQFENGIDPSNPRGGNPGTNSIITGSSAPVIQLIIPINAVQN